MYAAQMYFEAGINPSEVEKYLRANSGKDSYVPFRIAELPVEYHDDDISVCDRRSVFYYGCYYDDDYTDVGCS